MKKQSFEHIIKTESVIEKAINKQRDHLTALLKDSLYDLSARIASQINDSSQLESLLAAAFQDFQHCKYLYVMNENGVQITKTMLRNGSDNTSVGRDRSNRPYMQKDFSLQHFYLSEAYISKHNHRPSITAIHVIKNQQQALIGYLGVDYDLRELPGTNQIYQENEKWWQIKGDPAIRDGLFAQRRAQSPMDNHIDNVFALMEELILEHGVFHGKFHFSSSRATIWLVDDPYNYRILTMDELIDPDICLVHPKRPYFERASVPQDKINMIFKYFRELRFADETIYLRAGSINIVNGMVSLNFSCDGSHYLPYHDFLNKGLSFWFGNSDQDESSNHDQLIETICLKGCQYVADVIINHHQGIVPEEMSSLPKLEQQKLIKELETIMKVYEGI